MRTVLVAVGMVTGIYGIVGFGSLLVTIAAGLTLAWPPPRAGGTIGVVEVG